MQYKMRNGLVAIELFKPEEKTPNGIIIPPIAQNNRKALQFGKVLAVGPGELVQGQFVEMDLKKNDEVVFDASRAESIQIDGNTLYICNMIDVVMTINAKHLSIVPKK
ncbi:MAG: co-chaperone GroES [Candidatus Thorarchaeota archaeon]